mgnify:CR=1 FL=1
MAYNTLSGTVIAPDYFGPVPGGTLSNIISGNLGKSDGSTLSVTGDITASVGISASVFIGDGSRLTGISSSGGTIGAAEDGSYTDGLFTDFTSETLIGVPVDRFNEVLKILAPSPAPGVRSINEQSTNGVTAKLSFGAGHAITGYSSSATAAGFDAVGRSGSYAAAMSGSNVRLT